MTVGVTNGTPHFPGIAGPGRFGDHICAVTHVYTDQMMRTAKSQDAYIEGGLRQSAVALGHMAICHATRSEFRTPEVSHAPGTVVQHAIWVCSPREAKRIERNIRKRQLQCALALHADIKLGLATFDRKFREAMVRNLQNCVISREEFTAAIRNAPASDTHLEHQLRRLEKFIRRLGGKPR